MFSVAALTLIAGAAPALPWISDDWAAAKKRAIAEKKLVAVDVWATWCHSCLSMKNYTLNEAPLAAVKTQHVWLALDYDRPENAGFFGAFPVSSFPTFLVVDPASETVVSRWVGTGSAEQMRDFFASARREAGDPLTAGARALASKKHEEAKAHFEGAIARAASGADLTRAYNGLLEALSGLDPKACAERGLEAIERTEDTAPGIDAVLIAADCASELEDPALRDKVHGAARARLERAKTDGLSVDDRSGLYAALADLYDRAGERAKGDEITLKRLGMLEAAAKAAKTPVARATFDPHRVECYLRLERYDAAEAMLLASEKTAPKDFNPPARLALVYKAKKDHPRALAAIERALAIGYGPRRMRLHSTKIDVLLDAGRNEEARAAIAAARAEIARMDPKLVRASWAKGLDAQQVRADAKAPVL